MTTLAATWVQEFGLEQQTPPYFFRRLEQLDELPEAHPQAHAIRRAWQEMKLDGVYCFERSPVVYFKTVRKVDDAEIRTLHRQVWNQGIAPLLVLIAPTSIQVFSGLAVPASEAERPADHDRLVQLLDRTADVLEIANFIKRVELGDIFRERSRCFDPHQRVDRQLLNNLGRARTLLREAADPPLSAPTIHAILGRVIFICYLVDREIINGAYFRSVGAKQCNNLLDLLTKHTALEARDLLYALFNQLRAHFNGDLFDADLAAEKKLINAKHIKELRRLLSAENLATGQLALGFSAYDFRFIPIETISAIYERFLDAEDSTTRREIGAYYTPRFLAEVALDVALEGFGPLLGKRFLDPSCGSGIFLVGLFNRLAEEWRAKNPRTTNDRRARELIDLLKESIFGVDLNETACRIAALSLYLALLDQLSPRDIRELQAKGRVLPKLVCYGPHRQTEVDGSNIFYSDFFNDRLQVGADYHLVVGNPPWARATGPMSLAERWCDKFSLPTAQRQLAYAFIWKAQKHLKENAQVCFVLPAATLFNHHEKSLRFQAAWLSTCSIDLVLNLADMCFYLFDGAKRPAIIAKYRPGAPPKGASIPYVVPKTEYEGINAEVLTISDLDRIELPVPELLADLKATKPPLTWKVAMWASPRGRKFLDRLREYPTLDQRIKKSERTPKPWAFAEGFNAYGDGKAVDRSILHKLPFLPTRAVSTPYVVLERDTKQQPPLYDPKRGGNELTYRQPHLLFPHGVPRTGERLKAAYSSFDCSFEHSIRGIHAPANNEDELRFLTCSLASPLALYFFFHTAANWGTERAKIHVEEYGRFPLPPADTPRKRQIVSEIVDLHKRLESEADGPFFAAVLEQRQYLFDSLVYEYYEVDAAEKSLIDDTVNVWITSATPRRGGDPIPSLEPSLPGQRERYMRLLVQSLTGWMIKRGIGIVARPILSPRTNFGVLRLTITDTLEKQIGIEQASSKALDEALERVRALLPARNGTLRQMRDLKAFDGDDLYVLKPLSRRYWTDTAALNDADEVMMAIIRYNEGA